MRNDFKRKDTPLKEESGYDNVVAGRNAVLEALNSEDKIYTVYIAKGQATGTVL